MSTQQPISPQQAVTPSTSDQTRLNPLHAEPTPPALFQLAVSILTLFITDVNMVLIDIEPRIEAIRVAQSQTDTSLHTTQAKQTFYALQWEFTHLEDRRNGLLNKLEGLKEIVVAFQEKDAQNGKPVVEDLLERLREQGYVGGLAP